MSPAERCAKKRIVNRRIRCVWAANSREVSTVRIRDVIVCCIHVNSACSTTQIAKPARIARPYVSWSETR